jgi:anti-sigma B factor antagonist
MDEKYGIENIDGVIVLSPLTDFLDASNREELRAVLESRIANGALLVIDLSAVRFVDSSGLGVLMSALKRARSMNGDLVACSIVKPVKQLFNLVRLDKVMVDYPDKSSAVAALKNR